MALEYEMIGLIAGGGKFPFMIAESARKKGFGIFAIAHEGETDPGLSKRVDKIKWIKLGKFGELLNTLQESGVKKAIMAGTIKKRRMFEGIRPDFKGLILISRLTVFHDDKILRAVANEIEKAGINVVSCASLMPELLAPSGCLTRRKPTRDELEDIKLGWKVAKELGRMDVGQCVVVKRKTVLAMEAIEGTDETIRRGGRLSRGGAIVVKVSKPDQDFRFDIPSVGLQTIEVMREVGASVLAIETGKTLIFEKDQMIRLADREKISIISREWAYSNGKWESYCR